MVHPRKNRGQLLLAPPQPYTSKRKASGFLALPGEIRNAIYECYFEGEFRAELAAQNATFEHRKPRTVTLYSPSAHGTGGGYQYLPKVKKNGPATVRMARYLGGYKRVHGFQTKWSSSLSALVLVCKQVHYETIKFLYQNTTFAFDSSRRVLNFLDYVPKPNLAYITRLHLHYVPYGAPAAAPMRTYQNKHMKIWDQACKGLADRLVNLRDLYMSIKFPEGHYFSLDHAFLQPLYRFRARQVAHAMSIPSAGSKSVVAGAEALQSVKVEISTCASSWVCRSTFVQTKLLELHALFNVAVARFIAGWSEAYAFADFEQFFKPTDPELDMHQLRAIEAMRFFDQRGL